MHITDETDRLSGPSTKWLTPSVVVLIVDPGPNVKKSAHFSYAA